MADALYQAGELARAEALLKEAEAHQARLQHSYPRLYSVPGYRYCDLLLTQDRPAEVRDRARQTLGWVDLGGGSLLDIALDHLSLGRAALALVDHSEAGARLDQAVDDLRRAGMMDYLPRGLLARAALFRTSGDLPRARQDLDETMRITKRSEMRLFQCDAHLEYARLALEGDKGQAREHVAAARRLVEETGYGRRRPEVEALEAQVR